MPRVLNNIEIKDMLRKERERVCFPIVNRGRVWYNCLTDEQYVELEKWYWDWLNVTETLIVPVLPTWLNYKLTKEEIVL